MTGLIKESKQKQVTGENARATHVPTSQRSVPRPSFSVRLSASHGMQIGPDPPKKKINKPLTEK